MANNSNQNSGNKSKGGPTIRLSRQPESFHAGMPEEGHDTPAKALVRKNKSK